MTLLRKINNLFSVLSIELLLMVINKFRMRLKIQKWQFLTKELKLIKNEEEQMVIKAEKNEDAAEENKIAKEVTIKVLFIKLPRKKRNLL